LAAHLNALEKSMRDAAADLDFEKAARLRDEIKRLKAAELAVMDDPIARDEARAVEGGNGRGGSKAGNGKGGTSARRESISPLEGEMSGRTEGGVSPSEAAATPPSTPAGASPPQGGRSTRGSLFAKPDLDDMGRDIAEPAKGSLFRRNSLDEMTVGRTEKPVTGKLPPKPATEPGKRFSPLLEGQPERADPSSSGSGPTSPSPSPTSTSSSSGLTRGSTDDPRPLVRGKIGAGSYEDGGEQKRKGRTKGKTGRPGR